MKVDISHIFRMVSTVGLLLAGCATPPTLTPSPIATRSGQLTPYVSPTSTLPFNPTVILSSTPLPSPTSIPITYTVKAGEDMGGIAYRFGVTTASLRAANPTVDPRAMKVGTVLIIPPGGKATPTPKVVTPTPLPLQLSSLHCYPSREGGLWCFLPVNNPRAAGLENLSARVRLTGVPAQTYLEQIALPLLNRLPGQSTLILAAYFAAPVPEPFQASAELLTALPIPDGARYLPAQLQGVKIQIATDGATAKASGQVLLDKNSPAAAKTIWVAATAYDAQGNPVGIRRWDAPAPINPDQNQPFSLVVSSLGGSIARVDLLVEARP